MNKVLILGGTNFIGRRLVEFLIKNSTHQLTLFNRGKTNPSLFPNCRIIIGDRLNTDDLEPLFSQSWDYIIDLSCFFPKSLKVITKNINKDLSKYIFISTCSVYDNIHHIGMLRNEKASLLKCNETEERNTSLDTYGKRKAACEQVLIASKLPMVILRPSLVYGPYDHTDRLYYWIKAVQSKQEFILPESGNRLFSVTYVDDLVRCILSSIESPLNHEIYNCISHPSMSIGHIVNTSSTILHQKTRPISINANFLKNENISQWFDLPLWLNTDKFTFSNQKIITNFGFKPTNFEQSLRETIEYYQGHNFPEPQYGMDSKRKNKLIKKYQING